MFINVTYTHVCVIVNELNQMEMNLSEAERTSDRILPRKQPVQERSRIRFERILEVSLEQISKKGIDAVTMNQVAEIAEISIASLYQYFPDKTSIVATLAERFNCEGQDCVSDVFGHVAEIDQLKPAVYEMMDSYYEFFQTVPGTRAIWQAVQSDPQLHYIDEEDMLHHTQSLKDVILRVMPNFPPDEAVRMAQLFTSIIGMTVRQAIALSEREALALIESCKSHMLSPAIDKLIDEHVDR